VKYGGKFFVAMLNIVLIGKYRTFAKWLEVLSFMQIYQNYEFRFSNKFLQILCMILMKIYKAV
jgi:hypothetical protein